MKQQPDYRIYLLHIFALNGFAVVQPVLDLLGNNADFFIARGSQLADMVALVTVLVFGLTLLLLPVYKSISMFSNRGLQLTHYIMVVMLIGIFFLPVLNKLDTGDAIVMSIATGIGILFTIVYHKFQGLRLFVTALSPLSFIFAGIFLHGPSTQQIALQAEMVSQSKTGLVSSKTPVIMLIFDEFALTALMDAQRNIDKTVFPNFHWLSENASWYRNATTVATSTMLSVPAILTGNYAKEFVSQSFTNYPNTLFTMLADSHRMNVYESTTSLCSPELCKDSLKLSKTTSTRISLLLADVSAIYLHIISPATISSRLPVINMTWENYWQAEASTTLTRHNYGGRLQQLEFFVDSITKSEAPGLHFVHTNFPHLPYQYLPSGNRYQGEWELPGLDFSTDQWNENQWLITQAYQRFMLQAATADLLIGKLIDHLKSIDSYDESLIIVTADHGVSFYPNTKRRDAPPLINLERDVLPIPLFIKYPQQKEGAISDQNVETIDILPTIADVLDAKAVSNMDGRSLLSKQPPRTEKLAVYAYKDFLQFRGDADGELKYDTLKWKLENFNDATGLSGLFKIGQYSELVGLQLESLDTRVIEGLQIRLNNPDFYAQFDTNDSFVPSNISGTIQFAGTALVSQLAITVNGVVRAVTQMYASKDQGYKFSAMVPEQSFKKGNNAVSAYLISKDEHGKIELLTEHKQLTQNSATAGFNSWIINNDKIIGAHDEIPVVAEKVKGNLEYAKIHDGTMEFFGWAMDVANPDTVDKIMIFEDGQYVYSNTTSMPRDEGQIIGAPSVIIIGFQFIIPANLFRAPGDSDIRLFAISKYGYATELEYFDEYNWISR